MKKSIVMIRHGETDLNLEKRISGQKDVDLNDNGILDSYKSIINLTTNLSLNNKRMDRFHIISSPLKRAKFQAEILEKVFIQKTVIDDRLMERDWGSYTADYKSSHKGALHTTPPNGESYAGFQKRVADLKHHIVSKKEDIILITHMGVIRELCFLFGLKKDQIHPGQILKISIDEDQQIYEEQIDDCDSFIYFYKRKIEPAAIEKFDETGIITYIKKMHKDQVRANGSPYYLHLLRVYSILKKAGEEDDHVLKAALLHDIIEDTAGTYEQLIKLYSSETADIVKVLTLDKKISYSEQKDSYISSIIHSGYDSIIVKLADLIDNLSDFEGVPEERQIKMVSKAQNISEQILSGSILKKKTEDPDDVNFKKCRTINILLNNLLFLIINRSMNYYE